MVARSSSPVDTTARLAAREAGTYLAVAAVSSNPVAVALKQQLIALDRRVIGRSYDAHDATSYWMTGAAAAYPIVTGAAAAAAFAQSQAAGVGVLLGLLLAMPLAALARLTSRK